MDMKKVWFLVKNVILNINNPEESMVLVKNVILNINNPDKNK